MKNDRMARINRLIQAALAELLRTLKDPQVSESVMLSVVGVKATPDLQHAKVFLTALGDEKEQQAVLKTVAAARGHLRSELGRRVRLKRTPELHFELDRATAAVTRIEDVLQELAEEQAEEQDE